jgi:hypothetical protein
MTLETNRLVTPSLHNTTTHIHPVPKAERFRRPRNLVAIALPLVAMGCFPPGVWPPLEETTISLSETDGDTTGDGDGDGDTGDGDGDGDGDPGDGDSGDGDGDPCVGNLPIGWGEELVDVWLHSCDTNGTFIECCAAVRTEDGHLSVATAFAGGGGGTQWWGTYPLFAGAGELEGPWESDGSTRTDKVHWDYCGLPVNDVGENPTTRTFELHVTDHNLGVTGIDSVTMGGGKITCPDDWPCDGEQVVECSDDGCWASSTSWTGEAKVISQETIDAIANDPELWPPVDLGLDHPCWQVSNSNLHICVVETCNELLYGQPVADLVLGPPSADCNYVGPWESTATILEGNPAGSCVGVIDGVAVVLRGI